MSLNLRPQGEKEENGVIAAPWELKSQSRSLPPSPDALEKHIHCYNYDERKKKAKGVNVPTFFPLSL